MTTTGFTGVPSKLMFNCCLIFDCMFMYIITVRVCACVLLFYCIYTVLSYVASGIIKKDDDN